MDYYVLFGHTPIPTTWEAYQTWVSTQDTVECKRVDHIQCGHIAVSTIFLGMNHQYGNGPPLVFETMIFGGRWDQHQTRCSTWEEAEAMHKRACVKAFPLVVAR